MTLSNQVVSLELAKRLKELGVNQESYFHWYDSKPTAQLHTGVFAGDWFYAAFTVAELGEMLPARLTEVEGVHRVARLAMEKQDTRWNVVYICAECGGRIFEPMLADTEADARAKMLIYLIENNLVTV